MEGLSDEVDAPSVLIDAAEGIGLIVGGTFVACSSPKGSLPVLLTE